MTPCACKLCGLLTPPYRRAYVQGLIQDFLLRGEILGYSSIPKLGGSGDILLSKICINPTYGFGQFCANILAHLIFKYIVSCWFCNRRRHLKIPVYGSLTGLYHGKNYSKAPLISQNKKIGMLSALYQEYMKGLACTVSWLIRTLVQSIQNLVSQSLAVYSLPIVSINHS